MRTERSPKITVSSVIDIVSVSDKAPSDARMNVGIEIQISAPTAKIRLHRNTRVEYADLYGFMVRLTVGLTVVSAVRDTVGFRQPLGCSP